MYNLISLYGSPPFANPSNQRSGVNCPRRSLRNAAVVKPFRNTERMILTVEEQVRGNRKYPWAPLTGVGAVAIKNGKILLVKRAFEPGKGKWSIPGGLVELGERLVEACAREMEEETGIKVHILELINAYDMIVPDDSGKIMYHYVLIDFLAKPIGGTEKASVEVLEMKWVTYDEAKSMDLTNSARNALQELFGGAVT